MKLLFRSQKNIALTNRNLQDLQHDINRLATLESQMQAQHAQAQQLLHAQQISNLIYGSQQHITGQFGRPSMPTPAHFGSSPHLSQQQQQQQQREQQQQQHQSQQYQTLNNHHMRPPSRDPHAGLSIQYINDQGQYINQSPVASARSPYNDGYSPAYLNQYADAVSSPPTQSSPMYHNNDSYNHHHSPSVDYHVHRPLSGGLSTNNVMRESNSPQTNQFYLHDTPPQPAARRTWSINPMSLPHQPQQSPQQQQSPSPPQQPHQQIPLDINAWEQNAPNVRTWKSPKPVPQLPSTGANNHESFMLHQNGSDYNNHRHEQQHHRISQIISGNT